MPDASPDLDVVVIGAGFAGLYSLHKLRASGFAVRVYETGDGVGGTWFWNRYPGARCDVESIEYSFSFSPEIEQEWDWTELMPSQPELERYLNFVCDRLDLRRDIQLGTKVVAATYDEAGAVWTVETEPGERVTARFVVAATGCLSAPLEPDIAGLGLFAGDRLHTNRFPREGYDFGGKRVAVIGTGSSGVQVVPEIAEQASSLHVFQRSAAYTIPSNTRPFGPGELAALKADYPEIRRVQKESYSGTVRFGALSALATAGEVPERILEASREEQLGALDERGWLGAFGWADVRSDLDANKAATALYGEMIGRVVADPEVAASLVPQYPFGCKRPIIDVGYFATFNRDNVTLVDLKKDPIVEVTEGGIRTEQREVELDVIVLATGFDAFTGALRRIDIRGRGGRRLSEVWAEEPGGYLGLQVAGFPNLFTITGPGSPSVLTNLVTSIEVHVDWIAECLGHLAEHRYRAIEATPEAQAEWLDHCDEVVAGQLRTHESCNSWYLGANVPGKRRRYLPYGGGFPAYRDRCDAVAAAGYAGFALS